MSRLEQIWHSRNAAALLLWPLSQLFAAVSLLRRLGYRIGLLRRYRSPVPVIVVGNITVGGTGKTPLVIWLADYLQHRGLRPGIVSRGYGGQARQWPQQVRADSDPVTVGDEAVMIAARTGCPMCVGPDRPAAVQALLDHTGVDIVLSDDGMQHYALDRDLEIAVIDGERRFGNAFLLPAGPMREPPSRLKQVDIVIANGQGRRGECSMEIQRPTLHPLTGDGAVMQLADWSGRAVHAVAGIGNPGRFFELLESHGLAVERHPFDDHHAYRAEDLAFDAGKPVLMTEKDAVKCRWFTCNDCWVVRVTARPDAAFVHRLDLALKEMIADGQETPGHPGVSDL